MPTIERFSPFVKFSKWRKSRRDRENQRHRSVAGVTEAARTVGLDSSYYSFEEELNDEMPVIVPEKSKKARKSRNKPSVLSLMCGLGSTEFDCDDKMPSQPSDTPTENSKGEVTDTAHDALPTTLAATVETHAEKNIMTKIPKASTPDKRKSWMSVMCGADNLDFDINKESSAPIMKAASIEEHRKSWLSLVCGVGKVRPGNTPSRCRDSGISLLSEENDFSPLDRKTKRKSRSCDDILDNFKEANVSKDSGVGESFDCGSPSMNNLFRTTSIQESAFKITHRRRQNLKRRRGQECFSCCSERDIPTILKSSRSEGDLLNINSEGQKDVRFSGNFEDFNERSVSSADMNRYASRQLKPWQIRRQNRDQKNKLKRESRNLELMLSKEVVFEERLIE